MSPLPLAADVIGLILLGVAVTAASAVPSACRRLRLRPGRLPAIRALAARWHAPRAGLRVIDQHAALMDHGAVLTAPGHEPARNAGNAAAAGRPRLVLVEDRVPGPAALELEKPVGPRD
jgi:hypothetical protein